MALKHVLMVFSLTVISAVTTAQITIKSSHLASAGDTLRYSNAGIVSGNALIKTGESFHWDFRGVQPVSQGLDEFKQSWQTPYILSFGFTAIGLKIADTLGVPPAQTTNVYQFFRKGSSRWEGVGLGFVFQSFPLPQAGKHSNSEIIYQLPMTYEDNFSDSFEVSLALKAGPITAGTYFQKGRRTVDVDGYGWVSTPYQDSMPCIRIKAVIRQTDSVSVVTPKVNFAFPNNRVEYEWWTTSEGIPVMKAIGTEVGSTFIPNTVRYRDRYRDIDQLFFKVDFKADKLNLEVDETATFTNTSTGFFSDYSWSITPQTFQFVNGTKATDESIDVQFEAEGTYTIALQGDNAFIDPLTEEKKDYVTVSKSTNSIGRVQQQAIVIPNPIQSSFTMNLSELKPGPISLEIHAFDGRLLESVNLSGPQLYQVNTDDWPTGMVTLKLMANNTTTTFKLIKL